MNERRKGLLEWGFGECRCKRCVDEAKLAKASDRAEAPPIVMDNDLERELKAGLGVM